MLSRFPRTIASLSLATPLVLGVPNFSTDIEGLQSTVSFGIKKAFAQEPDCKTYAPQRLMEGFDQRIIQVHGLYLPGMRECAEKELISWLETMIKNPKNRLTLRNLECDIWYENKLFHLSYSVTVTPATDPSQVHRVVDMRGAIHYGPNAKEEVRRKNGDIPPWIERMKKAYRSMNFGSETALAESIDENSIPIFHEAVLVVGASR